SQDRSANLGHFRRDGSGWSLRRVSADGRSDRRRGNGARGAERDRQRPCPAGADRYVASRSRGQIPAARGAGDSSRNGLGGERHRRRARGAQEENSHRIMSKRLVVCMRWRPGGEGQETQSFASVAEAALERMAALGGRLILWHPEWLAVDFSLEALQDAIDFIVDSPAQGVGTGFAY